MGKYYGGSQEVQPKAQVLLLEGEPGTAGDVGKGYVVWWMGGIRLPSLNVVKVKMKMKFQKVNIWMNGWMDRE